MEYTPLKIIGLVRSPRKNGNAEVLVKEALKLAQAKIFMDRTYALRYPYHKLRNKPAGAIVVAGRRGCMSALSAINNFFLGQDMLPVGLGIAGYRDHKGEIIKDKKSRGRSKTTKQLASG